MLGAALLLTLLGLLAPAVPEPPKTPAGFTLDWQAPPGCSSAEAIEARVAALLQGPPAGEGVAEVEASVEHTAAGVHMRLTTRFEGSVDARDVNAGSCAALAEATAVLLAVSLEPGLEVQESGPEPHLEPAAEPEPDPRPVAPPQPIAPAIAPPVAPAIVSPVAPAQARGSSALHFVARIGAGVEWGALRDVAGGLRLGAGVQGPHWRATLAGTYLAPRRGAGGLYQLGTVGVRGCWRRGADWDVSACVGGEIGGLRVDTRGLDPDGTQLGPYAAPLAVVGVARTLGPLALWLDAEGAVRAWGSQTLLNGAVLQEQRRVSLRMIAGVQIALP